MDTVSELKSLIKKATNKLGIESGDFSIEYPTDSAHGDFSTNVALLTIKNADKNLFSNSRELANSLVTEVLKFKPDFVEKIEMAGPGFINFFLSKKYFSDELQRILKEKKKYGRGTSRKRERVIIEYTDPNPFKQFHIGHLMSNAIGESLSRLVESQGARVIRLCYQGDVGMHVAKAMWGIEKHLAVSSLKLEDLKKKSLLERTKFLGESYTRGSKAFEDNQEAKKEIEEINKKLFEGEDRELMKIYFLGKKWSLEHFDEIYKELGTKFDKYIFESSVADDGVKIVKEFLKKGPITNASHGGASVFEESDGAIVFKGEKYDSKLHTRVFINSHGIPTYETKELGLNKFKWDKWKPEKSIIITANEQSDYFRVVLKALELIAPEARKVTEHIAHGMLRFAEGKMSSRKGNVITGESLLEDVKELVYEKIKDRNFDDKQKKEVSLIVAVAAIKYSILRQAIGGDIIYDFEKSISFEGDSGPYLLYTAVRAQSVLEKAKKEGVGSKIKTNADVGGLEKFLTRFPNVVSRAEIEKAPHHVATYLIELSSMFNAWYANTPIVLKDNEDSPHRVVITQAVRIVLENGLNLLGLRIPERM